MRAHRTMRPNDAFQLGVSCGLILEVGGVKDAHAITLHVVGGFVLGSSSKARTPMMNFNLLKSAMRSLDRVAQLAATIKRSAAR